MDMPFAIQHPLLNLSGLGMVVPLPTQPKPGVCPPGSRQELVSSPVMGNQDLRGISPHVTGLPPPDPDQLFTNKLLPAVCSGLTLTFHILNNIQQI